jgi:hypothetical protein
VNAESTSYCNKKAVSYDKRPLTDVQEYRKMAQTQQRILGSQSQERSYNDKKKLSKLFRKAGAGRFSQNIPTYKDIEACGDLYSWGSSQDGVLGHLVSEENDSVVYDEKGYMI